MFGFWGPTLRVKLRKAASIAASGLPLRNVAAHKGSRRSSLQDRRATGGGLDALLCDAWNEAVCAIRSPQLVGRNALRLLRPTAEAFEGGKSPHRILEGSGNGPVNVTVLDAFWIGQLDCANRR